jgi:hypothetical protein
MNLIVATTNQPRPSGICRRKMRVIGKKNNNGNSATTLLSTEKYKIMQLYGNWGIKEAD